MGERRRARRWQSPNYQCASMALRELLSLYVSPKPAHVREETQVPEKDLAVFCVIVEAVKGLPPQSISIPAATRNGVPEISLF